MSRLFPRIDQLGYVVPDLERAIDTWSRVRGVGPFFVAEKLEMPDFWFRGERSDPVCTLAIAYWGDLQLELVYQHNDAPSGYREFLEATGGGLQHHAYFSGDVAADAERCLAAGMRMLHDGLSPFDRATRFHYLETPGEIGTVQEVIQMTPTKRRNFATMKAAAAEWDSSRPWRGFDEL